jgi:hypothetical protein
MFIGEKQMVAEACWDHSLVENSLLIFRPLDLLLVGHFMECYAGRWPSPSWS